jgi:hypothetical protein
MACGETTLLFVKGNCRVVGDDTMGTLFEKGMNLFHTIKIDYFPD